MKAGRAGRSLLASLALFAFPFLCAHADDFDSFGSDFFETYPARPRSGFHGVSRIGVTVGGDTITKITHANGSISELTAGGLGQIGAGALYRWEFIPVSAALTVNYHYNHEYNNNDNATFRRIPFEALAYVDLFAHFRIGGGMRYVYAARAESTINGVTETINFRKTKGSVVEIGYEARPYGWVVLRYVREDYTVASYSSTGTEPNLSGNAPYDGSHVGVFISYEY